MKNFKILFFLFLMIPLQTWGQCTLELESTYNYRWTSRITYIGQSITAPCTEDMTTIGVIGIGGATTLSIRSGDNVNGAVLYSVSNPEICDDIHYLNNPVSLTAGAKYTIRIDHYILSGGWAGSNNNKYSGGVSYYSTNAGASWTKYVSGDFAILMNLSGCSNDTDGDSVNDEDDNCPNTPNANQADSDGDGLGDVCDACPFDADNDIDGDGVCGDVDNCIDIANTDQTDSDGDGLGDVCDACPFDAGNDIDGDGVCGDVDNCVDIANTDQTDSDGDGLGDVCDACPFDADNDIDGDGVCGDVDNCVDIANTDQTDSDGDGLGDVCDACPFDADNDIDGDGVCGDVDNCVDIANTDQTDSDGDGLGDVCDACPFDADNDIDGDGVCGDVDNCPTSNNTGQGDADCDGVGDACDICPGGDDSVDNNGDGIADCSQLLNYNDYSAAWKCKNNKIEVNHNGNTVCINKNALSAHFNHGDYVGPAVSCTNRINNSTIDFGTSETHRIELEVFPNPATDEVNIHLHGMETAGDVMIFDLTGKLVFSQKVNTDDSEIQLNVSDRRFSNGIYMVRMVSEELSLTKRLVIQK